MNPKTEEEIHAGPSRPPSLYDLREPESLYPVHYSKDERTGEFMVWIDNYFDLEWEDDEAHGEFVEGQNLGVAIRAVETRIAMLEPKFQNWPKDLKLAGKRLLGEAIASAWLADFKGADFLLDEAAKFFKQKGPQVSRYWTLWSCLVTSGVMALIALFEVLSRSRLIHWMGMTPFLLSLSFCSGSFGAGFFVIMKLGKQPQVDSSAERHLHWLEGAARILGGGLGGFLGGGLVRLGVILPAFLRPGMEPLAMCLAAMLSGASERLISGVITRIESKSGDTTGAESPAVQE